MMRSTESSDGKRAGAARPRRRFPGWKAIWKQNREGWMFVLPLVIGLAIFTCYPMIQSLIWAFFNYTGDLYFYPVGFGNFTYMFTRDREFWQVLGNTFFYAMINLPLTLVTSYLLACLVNTSYRFTGIFRVFYYLPCMIPGVVSGLLWKDIFSQNGIFNHLLALFGTHSDFFESSSSGVAIGSIFLMNLWSIGGGMILWLSAFKSIPGQLYESAKIDGAGMVQRFLHITIPMSMPMIFFNVVTGMIGTLQYNGTMTYAANGKGVDNALYMMGVKIYNTAFVEGGGQFGYASALSWFLLIVVAILTAFTFWIRKKLYMGEGD